MVEEVMEWRTIRRETGLIEHGCEHGIGHPNIASACRMGYIYKYIYEADSPAKSWLVHGCDGCCSFEEFPGNILNTLMFSFAKYGDVTLNDGRSGMDLLADLDQDVYDLLFQISICPDEYSLNLWLRILSFYVQSQDNEWHDNYRKQAEFMYWGLKATQFLNPLIEGE